MLRLVAISLFLLLSVFSVNAQDEVQPYRTPAYDWPGGFVWEEAFSYDGSQCGAIFCQVTDESGQLVNLPRQVVDGVYIFSYINQLDVLELEVTYTSERRYHPNLNIWEWVIEPASGEIERVNFDLTERPRTHFEQWHIGPVQTTVLVINGQYGLPRMGGLARISANARCPEQLAENVDGIWGGAPLVGADMVMIFIIDDRQYPQLKCLYAVDKEGGQLLFQPIEFAQATHLYSDVPQPATGATVQFKAEIGPNGQIGPIEPMGTVPVFPKTALRQSDGSIANPAILPDGLWLPDYDNLTSEGVSLLVLHPEYYYQDSDNQVFCTPKYLLTPDGTIVLLYENEQNMAWCWEQHPDPTPLPRPTPGSENL